MGRSAVRPLRALSRTSSSTGLGAHGDAALRLCRRSRGSACSTSAAASATRRSRSPSWSVRTARRSASTRRRASSRRGAREAAEAGVANARFAVADVQTTTSAALRPWRSRASGRCSSPTRSPRCATCAARSCPAARLAMVVWRRREDNDWLYRAQQIVEEIVERPEEYDEPTCGPGPFSMADADTTSDVLRRRLRGRHPAPLRPADQGRSRRRRGDRARDGARPRGRDPAARRATAPRTCTTRSRGAARGPRGVRRPDGVGAPASTWIVTATAPRMDERRPLRPLPLSRR